MHVQSGTLTQERSAGTFILLAGKTKSDSKQMTSGKDLSGAVERYVSLSQIQNDSTEKDVTAREQDQ